jgi:AraC-like DNA-binding protein
MTGSGTAIFSDPEDYRARVGGTSVDLVVTEPGDFAARLTWLKLRQLHVLRGCENLPRVAYVSLTPARAFVSFPTSMAAPIWGGVQLQFGDVVFHGHGERTHQWTTGASEWGLISLPHEQLAVYGKALTGLEMTSPPFGRVLRPSSIAVAHLVYLHSKACGLAETRHEIVRHPEVIRALEQELLHALINCLTADDADGDIAARRHASEIMVRFDEVSTAHIGRPMTTSELSAAIGVPERTLKACCREFLGMGPTRYLRLRRLSLVRAALRWADPATDIAAIARRYGFSEPGRFATAYRAAFGEAPSTTLRGAGSTVDDSASAEYA